MRLFGRCPVTNMAGSISSRNADEPHATCVLSLGSPSERHRYRERDHRTRKPPAAFGLVRAGAGATSCLFGNRQTQSRQEKLAVLSVPQKADIRCHDRSDDAQLRYHLACIIEPSRMGVARG